MFLCLLLLFNLLIVLVLLVVSSQHLSCPGYAGSDPGSVCCNKPSILQINLLLLAELRATNHMVSILGGYQEGEEVGLLTGLHLRLHHRILGDVVKPTFGGVRTSPKDDCGMPWADYTGVFKDVVKPSNVEHQPGLINMGKYAPALRMTVRITRTMREQRNRDSNRGELRDTLSLHRCRGQIRHA